MANKFCPICGEQNHCMNGTEQDCWCTKEEFPQGIFELVPPESQRKHCICQTCLMEYKGEK